MSGQLSVNSNDNCELLRGSQVAVRDAGAIVVYTDDGVMVGVAAVDVQTVSRRRAGRLERLVLPVAQALEIMRQSVAVQVVPNEGAVLVEARDVGVDRYGRSDCGCCSLAGRGKC